MKKLLSISALFLFFLLPQGAFAVNEECAAGVGGCPNPPNASVCTAPAIIENVGGCPGSTVWIGDASTGQCETPVYSPGGACGAGTDSFLCETNTCYNKPIPGPPAACSVSNVNTGSSLPCCTDTQIAVRDSAYPTGWKCEDQSTDLWTESSGDVYRSSGDVGIGVTAPKEKLDIDVGADAGIGFTSSLHGSQLAAKINYEHSGSWASGKLNLGINQAGGVAEDVITIQGDGKVGIGTTSPDSQLYVDGDGASTQLKVYTQGADKDAFSVYGLSDESAYWSTGIDDNDNMYVISYGAVNPTGNMSAGAISILTNGNVGIGTTPAAYDLDVTGTVDADTYCISGANCVSVWPSSPWSVSGSDVYYTAGIVGIGTNSPANAELHVVGSGTTGIRSSGTTIGGHFTNPASGFAYVSYGDFGISASGNNAGGAFSDADSSGIASVAQGDTGISASGNTAGGQFTDLDSSGFANVGYGDTGIDARGNTAGGYFKELDSVAYANVASSDYGIQAYGNNAGGFFDDLNGSGQARIAWGDYGMTAEGNTGGGVFSDTNSSAYTIVATGDNGIDARGNNMGGYFKDLDGSAIANVAYGDIGIEATGNTAGGSFSDADGSGYATVADGDSGITAGGNLWGAYFEDANDSAYARVAYGNDGIQGYGNNSGGYFKDLNNTGSAYVGWGNYGINASGIAMGGLFTDADSSGVAQVASDDNGIYARGNQSGGYFADLNSSGYAYVGYGDLGIDARGNTAGGYFKDATQSGYSYVGAGDYGISAWGNTAGGEFNDINGSGTANVAYGDYGIYARGNSMGGYFADLNSSAYTYIAYGDAGIQARGSSYGGYFADTNGKNAYVGYGTYSLYGNGSVYITSGSGYKPFGGSWSSSSDIRLKDIKGDYGKGLNEIIELNPIEFRFKADNPLDLPSDVDSVGFIAQDVQDIFPESISEDDKGYLVFDMHSVNVAVINAIKELKAENDELRSVVCELKPDAEVCNQ